MYCLPGQIILDAIKKVRGDDSKFILLRIITDPGESDVSRSRSARVPFAMRRVQTNRR